MFKYIRLPFYAGLVAVGAASAPVVSHAQAMIEEVVVTARKRSESLQDVPLAITPISGEALEKQGFVNLTDVAGTTPGLSYMEGATSGYQGSATIRGLAQGFLQDRVQNVAVFLDGVYLQRQSMANMGMVDMARIEVVKGPQNSLYGRNAFAGAINYVTQKPTEEFDAYVSATYGDHDREDYRATVSGPIIDSVLLGRASFGTSFYDGHTKNPSPFAKFSVPGYNNSGSDGMLGGYDDETFNIALTFMPSDSLTFSGAYYKTRLKREEQPRGVISGALEVAGNQATPYGDMNFNPVPIATVRRNGNGDNSITYGNTMWQGRFPLKQGPGTWLGNSLADQWNDFGELVYKDNTYFLSDLSTCDPLCDGLDPVPDPRIYNAVDHRGTGFTADSDILTLGVDWEIDDQWALSYLYGWVDHTGTTGGSADRDIERAWLLNDISVVAPYTDPFVHVSAFSSRPIIDQKVFSHELRFDWAGNDTFSGSFGAYYSKVEDEQFDQTTFVLPCSTVQYDNDADPMAGCNSGVSSAPMEQFQGNGVWLFFRDQWSFAEASKTAYEDTVSSFFGMLEYNLREDITLRVEARYTEEDKSIKRTTDLWGFGPGEYGTGVGAVTGPISFTSKLCVPGTDQNYNADTDEFVDCIDTENEKTYYYFTPKAGIDWHISDDNFVYAYAAKGLKTGGFNNTLMEEQSTYDEEVNWTYELGSKNTFYDGRFQLNASVYYIQWEDSQGKETPRSSELVGTAQGSVIGNIGDIENHGIELDSVWLASEAITVNFGYAFTNPKYEDDVTYDAAQRYYFYQCTEENLRTDTNVDGSSIGGNYDNIIDKGELCGNTDVSGNTPDRVSKHQLNFAVNYSYDFSFGWSFDARLDSNYQSKQYVTPLNLAYIPSRTLWNASMAFVGPEHWEVNLWGKNIFNKEYISGVFVTSNFNKFMLAYGASPTYGATLKYSF